MKNNKIKAIIGVLVLLMTASCSDEYAEEYANSLSQSSDECTDMTVNANIADVVSTRSCSTYTEWNSVTGRFGLAVTLYSGNNKDAGLYPNGKETVNYTLFNGVWGSSVSQPLYKQLAYPTAYYPYNFFNSQGYSDPTALPVDVFYGVDVLYAPLGDNTVNVTSPNATLTMKHALALIKVKVKNNGYTGKGEITSLNATSEAFGTEGMFDSTTGLFTDVVGTHGYTSVYSCVYVLDSTFEETFLSIPNSETEKPVVFTLKIDNQNYTCTINSKFESGKMYVFELSISDVGLNMSRVELTSWDNADIHQGVLDTNE